MKRNKTRETVISVAGCVSGVQRGGERTVTVAAAGVAAAGHLSRRR